MLIEDSHIVEHFFEPPEDPKSSSLQGACAPHTEVGDSNTHPANCNGGLTQGLTSGSTPFAEAARLYELGYLSREQQIAKPTREKETYFLTRHLVPRWGPIPLSQIYPQAIEEWLHTSFRSWWTMHGVRGIMSRVFHYAEGHGLWEGRGSNPATRAKLGKKRYRYERCILSFEETAQVLSRLREPNLLIIETCIATGARISEILGLKWKHVSFSAATIQIEQRLWRQEIDRPKTEGSRRTLGLGMLAPRYHVKALRESASSEAFVFQQRRNPGKALWDSGVRDALHQAAKDANCDFAGLGPHSFRRANITWRQQVGGSAIEASRIAGHTDLKMTGEYTFVDPARQNELTLRIQRKLAGSSAAILGDAAPLTAATRSADESKAVETTLAGPGCFEPRLVVACTLEKGKSKAVVRKGSKAAAILALVSKPEGATRSEIMRLTGWAAHSVRGFISGIVMKRMGRVIESIAKDDGDRLYRILP